ncbi:MAG: hypothetical protein KKA81_00015 [Bacteroidetes bacterium]|nr:hypothetical protein [Bacteroidota bacterium]
MGKRGKADRQTVLMNYKLWLTSLTGNGRIGDGTFFILHCLKENPDLFSAAEKLGFSYKQAKELIREAESITGYAITECRKGASAQEFTHLTPAGEKLLEAYQSLNTEFDENFENAFREYKARAKS